MQLGGGNIHLGQKYALEGSKGQLKPQSSEDGGVNEAEGAFGIKSFIRTHRLTLAASHNPHELVVAFAENTRRMASLLLSISRYALKGCKGGRFL